MSGTATRTELESVFALATPFGLFAGLLAVASPYFLGLATSVAALATVAWLPRWRAILRDRRAAAGGRIGRAALLATGVAAGWSMGVGLVPLPWPVPAAALTAVVGLMTCVPRRPATERGAPP